MTSNGKKNEPSLGQPIPMGVIDVANETVDVPVQEPNDPQTQLSLLRGELDVLKSKIAECRTLSVQLSSSLAAATIAQNPIPATAILIGMVMVATMVVQSRLRPDIQPSRYRRGLNNLFNPIGS